MHLQSAPPDAMTTETEVMTWEVTVGGPPKYPVIDTGQISLDRLSDILFRRRMSGIVIHEWRLIDSATVSS